MISSPATYRDVQQELIAEIHRTSIWPDFVTVDGNISIPKKSDFIDKDGNYTILIPDRIIKSFKAEFGGIAEQPHGYTRLWISEARFVVTGANEFSMSQQIDIFDHFSQWRIYNCIIVSQGHYVIDKEYSSPAYVNDVDRGMKLGVCTSFPYQSSDRCTEVNDITLLDSWVISAQGRFTRNTDLFPRKNRNRLQGCPMKALIRNTKVGFTTISLEHTYSNDTHVRSIAGLEYDLFKLVYEQMNMSYVQVSSPGFGMENGVPVNKIIGAMFKNEVDRILGGLGR
jgi:hypothetical protein